MGRWHGKAMAVSLVYALPPSGMLEYSKQSPFPIGDLIVYIVPPGLFLGRIANFINGELWGRVTEIKWGVLFPNAPGFAESIARHPFPIIRCNDRGFNYLFIFVQWRFWKTEITSKCPGVLSGEFFNRLFNCKDFQRIFS